MCMPAENGSLIGEKKWKPTWRYKFYQSADFSHPFDLTKKVYGGCIFPQPLTYLGAIWIGSGCKTSMGQEEVFQAGEESQGEARKPSFF